MYAFIPQTHKTCTLEVGDKITFGHTNGYKIQPGSYAEQPHSEFQFEVRKNPSFRVNIGKYLPFSSWMKKKYTAWATQDCCQCKIAVTNKHNLLTGL